MSKDDLSSMMQKVAILSFALLFFTIPHTLEDFATGAPEEAGIPTGVLSFVISVIFFSQGKMHEKGARCFSNKERTIKYL